MCGNYDTKGIWRMLPTSRQSSLTQSINDLPFDTTIRYRLIDKTTYILPAIEEAMEKLGNYAKSFLEGTLLTGNPVTDFYCRDRRGGGNMEVVDGGSRPKKNARC